MRRREFLQLVAGSLAGAVAGLFAPFGAIAGAAPAASPLRRLLDYEDGQPFVGEIRMFAFNFSPAGWAPCDGQLLPISENETLFNLVGTTYGGDGESTFALPKGRPFLPYANPPQEAIDALPPLHFHISLFGIYPQPT